MVGMVHSCIYTRVGRPVHHLVYTTLCTPGYTTYRPLGHMYVGAVPGVRQRSPGLRREESPGWKRKD